MFGGRQVYWIPLEELKTKELATGMEYVLQILESEQVNECYMKRKTEGYVGTLYLTSDIGFYVIYTCLLII